MMNFLLTQIKALKSTIFIKKNNKNFLQKKKKCFWYVKNLNKKNKNTKLLVQIKLKKKNH